MKEPAARGGPAEQVPGGGCALILVDVIKGFFTPGGEFYNDVYPAILPAIRRLLSAARDGKRLVVHARETHRAGEPDFERIKLPVHSVVGTMNHEFVEGFTPGPGELEMPKRRYSAFFGTDLALRLSEYGVRRVVLAGCKTNVCVRATAQDAFAWGLEVIVPREAVTSNRRNLHEASLEDMDRYIGRVISLEEAVKILEEG